jgi:Tat protein secretion system quality control protein TatD with DNase activity
MGAIKGQTNDPTTVIESIETIATIKNLSTLEMKNIVRNNFLTLFNL